MPVFVDILREVGVVVLAVAFLGALALLLFDRKRHSIEIKKASPLEKRRAA